MTKEEKRIYNKQWREKYPEKMKAAKDRWRANNKEKEAATKKQWCEANPDRVKLQKQRYREKNRENIRAWDKEFRLQNLEERRASQKRYRDSNPEKMKNAKLRYAYGITLAEYNKMREVQSDSCAVCKRHESELSKKLVVDHCHTTGKIRKLLCSPCNVRLGVLENKEFVEMATAYLKEHL